jgi:hypothetical protein
MHDLIGCIRNYVLATVCALAEICLATVKGDDSAAIQKALDTKERPLTVIIPKGSYDIAETLKVGSRTHIKAHPEARTILNGANPHHCGDFLLSNADEQGGNMDIRIEGGRFRHAH